MVVSFSTLPQNDSTDSNERHVVSAHGLSDCLTPSGKQGAHISFIEKINASAMTSEYKNSTVKCFRNHVSVSAWNMLRHDPKSVPRLQVLESLRMLRGIPGSLFRWHSTSNKFVADTLIDGDARVSRYRGWEGELGSIEKLLRPVEEAASSLQRLHHRVECMEAAAVDARWTGEGPWNGHGAVVGPTVQALMTCVSLVIKVHSIPETGSYTELPPDHSMYGTVWDSLLFSMPKSYTNQESMERVNGAWMQIGVLLRSNPWLSE